MSDRELVVLGTASRAPTRERNHNGYLLRWDAEGILFDPGEGTQRQMVHAGVPPSAITRICITHFHGDHCLGLPGIVQRLSLDGVAREVPVHFPAGEEAHYERLRTASAFVDRSGVVGRPAEPGVVADGGAYRLVAAPLAHRVPCLGWRLEEPSGRRMLPEALARAGISGPEVGRILREGALEVAGRRVELAEVSAHRPGQVVAFVMDTALCDGAFALAEDADLLVCEATFASSEESLARRYGHLTAAHAGRIAAEAGVRRLVLTHFSARYPDVQPLADEARAVFGGDVVAAADLLRVPVPRRR